MKTTKSLLLLAVVIIIMAFFTYTEASAACSSTQVQNGECVDLGTSFTLQIVRTSDGQFPFRAMCQLGTNAPVACSVFSYFLNTGVGNNQLNYLVPHGFMPQGWDQSGFINTVAVNKLSGCSQLATDGTGDPTTGFGNGIKTFDTCRIAPSANANTLFGVALSSTANIYIATLPAVAGLEAMQLKAGKETFLDFILSSGGSAPQISTTSETFTTAEGATVSVNTDQSGNLIGTPGLRQVPQNNTRFCFPDPTYTPAPNEFPTNANWDCIPINFASNKCQIKGPGEDPWAYIGGTWILY
jgi:hypothetical protein